MAQHKYDLVTVPTKPAGPPKHHPWYKERLDLKFMKHGWKSGCLDGRKWTLLAGNMDDFRTGLPAHCVGTSMVVKGRVDPVPLVDSSKSLPSNPVGTGRSRRTRLPSRSLQHSPGHSTLHSKVGPQRQAKLARLQQLEDRLLQHPLSLYPHLKEGIPSEVAGDVLGILHVGRGPVLETASVQSVHVHNTECNGQEESRLKTKESGDGSGEDEEQEEEVSSQATVYRWPLRQTEEEVREEQMALAAQKVISPSQEARVDAVTHDLVHWGRELGGSEQTSDIDEATVKSLFASDYETRPITAPIHVVDLPNVPLELRGHSPLLSARSHHFSGRERDGRRSLTSPGPVSDIHRLRYGKSRYGAWYLPTNLWRLQRADEPLCDPRNLTSESTEELARQDEELNDKVSLLHGAQAFRDYYTIHKPGSSVPSFLQCVEANASSRNFYN